MRLLALPAELYPRFSSAPQLIAVDLLSIVRPGSFVNNFFQNFSVFFEAGGGGKSCPFSHRRSSLPLAAVRPGAKLLTACWAPVAARPDTTPMAAAVMASPAGKPGMIYSPATPRGAPPVQTAQGPHGLPHRISDHRDGGHACDSEIHVSPPPAPVYVRTGQTATGREIFFTIQAKKVCK